MRNEFDVLNRMKNVEEFEEVKISTEEKKKILGRLEGKVKMKNNKKIIAAAMVGFALVGTIGLTNENVLASVNNIGKTIESFFDKNEEVLKIYKEDILREVEDKGIKLMLHEVAIDDSEILISASVDYSKFNNEEFGIKNGADTKIIPFQMVEYAITQNGKNVMGSHSGGQYQYNENKTVDMLLSVGIADVDNKGDYEINLSVNKMLAQLGFFKEVEIEGNWNIDFVVNGDEIKADMLVHDINEEINIQNDGIDYKINLEELRVTPLSMRLHYNYNRISEGNKGVVLKVLDENGKEVDFISGGGNDEGSLYRYIIDREIKEITIIPGIAKYGKLDTDFTYYEEKGKTIKLD